MEYVVDRVEGDVIVLEIDVGKTIDVPLEMIPLAKEGDIIKVEVIKSTDQIKKIEKLMDKVFED